MDPREQLLAATVEVITTQGWRAATTRRIAEKAGVNEVTLFRHFGSKDALIREALAWKAARSPVATLPEEPGDARAELLAWAQQHYHHLLEIRSHVRRTIGEFDTDPEVRSWSRRVPTRLHELLTAYVARLRDQGRANGSWQPSSAAGLLLGALFADAIMRDLLPEPVSAETDDVPRRYVELLLAAIDYTA